MDPHCLDPDYSLGPIFTGSIQTGEGYYEVEIHWRFIIYSIYLRLKRHTVPSLGALCTLLVLGGPGPQRVYYTMTLGSMGYDGTWSLWVCRGRFKLRASNRSLNPSTDTDAASVPPLRVTWLLFLVIWRILRNSWSVLVYAVVLTSHCAQF